MANEKRLIDANVAMLNTYNEVWWTESEAAAVRSFWYSRKPWMPWKWCMGGGFLFLNTKTSGVRCAKLYFLILRLDITAPTAVQRWMVMGMTEQEYTQIMNRLFLESESILGDEMVYLETVGNVIREVCGMDGDGNA